MSNHLTHLFTVENIDYDRLEVSSPGLDRPLQQDRGFRALRGRGSAGEPAGKSTDGARRWKGILRGVDEGNVMLETDKGMRTIPVAEIDKARLVPKIDWRKGK